MDSERLKEYMQIQETSSAFSFGSCWGDQVESAIIEWVSKAVPRQDSILDLGCGDGRSIGVFKNLGYTKVVGFDLSETKLRVARSLGFEVIRGDMHNLSSLPKFDHVFASHCLEHAYDIPKVLFQIKSILVKMLWVIIPLETKKSSTAHFSLVEKPENFIEMLKSADLVVQTQFLKKRASQELWVTAVPG